MNTIFAAGIGTALLYATSVAGADIFYTADFESPMFNPGQSVHAIDGWFNGSNAGQGHSVSEGQSFSGSQSLKFDNTAFNSFSSVRRALPEYEDELHASVRVYLDGATQANRMYGMYLVDQPLGAMGDTALGLSIGGDGTIRAGTEWADTNSDEGIIGTASPGSYLDRWLEISLSVETDLATTVQISGFAGGGTVSADFLLNAMPLGLNLGADWADTTQRSGIGYFDDLVVSSQTIPAPGALALLGLAGLVSARRRRN